jgi:shikimate kinase
MGCGKTTVGMLLAERVGCRFIDCDAQIAEAAGMEIRDIFRLRGEPCFRRLERDFIESLRGVDGVVSTGGGAVLDRRNTSALRERGLVIYLKTSPERILSNIGDDDSRPLLDVPDRLAEITRLMAAREPLYEEAAHLVVESRETPCQTVNRIIKGGHTE